MKRAEGYLIKEFGEDYVILPTGKRAEEVNEVITLSETAGFIYLHAEEANDIIELAKIVGKEYGVEMNVVLEDVRMTVETLKERGILL